MPIQPTGERREILHLNRWRVWVVLIGACSCTWTAIAFAQPGSALPASNPTVTEKFTLTGTVVDGVSGEPVRKALVQLNSMPRRTTFTDSSGRFQFEAVSAGPVPLSAQKPGYFGEQELSGVGAPPIDVGPNTPPAVVKLFPESVIYGKVASSDGTPLEHVMITLTHANIRDGQRHWDNQGNTNTDEDGQYRFANLRPGTYYVGAGPYTPQSENVLAIDEVPTSGYRGVYYPGAPDRSSASPIQLSAGQQSQADFSLTEAPVYRVSGIVTGYTPNQNVGLQVLDQSGVQIPVSVEFSAENGRFDVRGVPAGNYVLKGFSQSAPNQNVRAELPFSLTQDLHNLHLGLSPAITIPINVTMEPQASANRPGRQRIDAYSQDLPLSVRLMSTGPGATDAFANLEGEPDQRKLVLHNVDPGRYSVVIDSHRSWYVAAAEYGQTNLLTDDLVISAGAPVQPLNIVLRNDRATLSVRVNIPDGVSPPVTILAIPEGLPKASPRVFPYFPSQEKNTEPVWLALGPFAPGPYRVYAFDRTDGLEYSNPEVMESYNSRAERVSLSPNQSTKVTLEVIRREEKN